uniref:Uncharacterized protein n=1 Tax=Sphaeramia orbicularis TaxID=375764 RepID=A0A673APD3_9TELE
MSYYDFYYVQQRRSGFSHIFFTGMCNSAPWTAHNPKHIHAGHDTMSYDLDINSAIIGPTILTKFGKIRWVRKIVKKWGTTQVHIIYYIIL